MKDWRKYNGAILPNHPPHVLVNNYEQEIRLFIKESNVHFARWTSDFDCKEKTNFWFVINDKAMKLEDYNTKVRNQIRKGLKNCEVKIIDVDFLIDKGYNVYISAFNTYKTYLNPKTKTEFIKEINKTFGDWQYWGVFSENKLIGYCKVKIFKHSVEYTSIKFHPDHLKLRPSEALIYTLNKFYLNDKKYNYVNNGSRSISHQTSFQDFLIKKFSFRKAYCRLHIIYSKKIELLVKIIFPFRRLFKLFHFGMFRHINILLKQEKIKRSFN